MHVLRLLRGAPPGPRSHPPPSRPARHTPNQPDARASGALLWMIWVEEVSRRRTGAPLVKASNYEKRLRYIRRIEATAMRLTNKAKAEPDPEKRHVLAEAAVKLWQTARKLREQAEGDP